MNRRKNKVDMEKIFAAVISLAIMLALVVGVVSILKSNNSESEGKKNYIDLNELDNVAESETTESETLKQAVNETETDGREETESAAGKDKSNYSQLESTALEEILYGQAASKEDGQLSHDGTEENGGDGDENVPSDSGDEGTDGVYAVEGQPSDEENQQVAQAGSENVAEPSAEASQELPADLASAVEAEQVNANISSILGYSFGADSTLMWPVQGDVILNYNMTNTIYFPTLDVYRCNPAIVISASEGDIVSAAADGIVMAVYDARETGLTLEIAIGSDYVLTYGQLKELTVGVGSQVSRGDVIGVVAAPSQYYTVEGANLYFRVDNADGPVNPMNYIE